MKYKLIISDFDSTLNFDYFKFSCSDRTRSAIQNYVKAGGKFCISTGRAWESISPHLSKYGIDKFETLIGCNNGASVHNNLTGEVLYKCVIPNKILVDLLGHMRGMGLHEAQVYIDDKVYVDKVVPFMADFAERAKVVFEPVGDVLEYVKQNKCDAYKIAVVWEVATKLDVNKEFEKYSMLDFTIGHMLNGETMIEITNIAAGKGNTAVEMAKMLNIDLSHTVGIGDADNDMTMIQKVGMGVCVANAIEKLKAIAKHITDRCDDDGVAKVLEKAMSDTL